ncbi:MAG: heme O synthase-like polyprenyltransferase [Arcticibacterium sp.]|jgi:heme O synthase-like polyprenyltransferase
MKLFYYLVLTRPANVITAVSDILAGVAIVGILDSSAQSKLNIILLCIATAGLYAGGIVFNDIFDLETDKKERPERIIPSGKVSQKEALVFGLILFLFGISLAFKVSYLSGFIATGIVTFALIYDKYAKHHILAGPLIMGLCRGLNLLLGMSVLANNVLPEFWMMAFIPIIFIAAITLTSQGEVLGKNKISVIFALFLDFLVVSIILFLANKGLMSLWSVIPFVTLWFGINFFAKFKAIKKNESKYIMNAVKMGVLSLIPLNASYVAGFSDWRYGIAVLLLLPISILLARKFSVT